MPKLEPFCTLGAMDAVLLTQGKKWLFGGSFISQFLSYDSIHADRCLVGPIQPPERDAGALGVVISSPGVSRGRCQATSRGSLQFVFRSLFLGLNPSLILKPPEAGVKLPELAASDFPARSLQLLTVTLGYGTLLLKRSPGFHKSTTHKHLMNGLETETKHLEWLII